MAFSSVRTKGSSSFSFLSPISIVSFTSMFFSATGFDISFWFSLQEVDKKTIIKVKKAIFRRTMNFNDFSKEISKIKKLPLPGKESHYKMAPLLRIQELKGLNIAKNNPRKAGVMALFYPDKHLITHLLLILRRTYKGVHSNQIGFPGGKEEKEDIDLLATALRETEEEVGVRKNAVEVIRSLSEIYIPPSNFEVQPYLGLYHNPRPFKKQDSEVEDLIEVPLLDFMDDKSIFNEKLSTSYAENIDVPAFRLKGYTVWGATAMMLSEIKTLLKQVI